MMGTRMIRVVTFAVLLVLVLAVPLWQACSKPPTPTPPPAPPKTTVAAPPSTPTVQPAAKPTAKPAASPAAPAAKARAPAQIGILGMSAGFGWYLLAGGISKMINEKSTWLKAQLVETTGAPENIRILQEMPEMRKTRIATGGLGTMLEGAEGKPPFKVARFTPIVAGAFFSNYVLATIDPKIRTPKDLEGKTVISLTRGSAPQIFADDLIEHWGLKNVKRAYGGFTENNAALFDGTAHATVLALTGPDWATNPSGEELFSSKRVYFIPITEADVKALNAKRNWGWALSVIPPGAVHKNQLDEVSSMVMWNAMFADKEMDSEIVYEILRVLYENHVGFRSVHAMVKNYRPAYMGGVGPENIYHPGAAKFLKEKGIKMAVQTSFK